MAKKKKTYYKKGSKNSIKPVTMRPKTLIITVVLIALVIGFSFGAYWFLVLRNQKGGGTSSEVPSSEVVSSSEHHSHSDEHSSIEPSSETSSSEVPSSEIVSSSEHHSHSDEHSSMESSSEMSSSEVSLSVESYSYSSEESNVASISINFLEVGNQHTGDCTYIKAGDADILIDAGSIQSSAKTIKQFVDQYCTDGKLEYVIATHAHTDHIAGFIGTTTEAGIFDVYEVDTLIQFARSDNVGKSLYNKYMNKISTAVEEGRMKNVYTALECVEEKNGAQKEYVVADGITMTILKHTYYSNDAPRENDYSVCTLFTQGDNHYLFTGDLEGEGEESLVAENKNLPHVQLFKAGHHGSETSNTDTLLSVITPEVVCVCCCAGNDEYTSAPENQFPTQTAINNIAKYTDKIYVTTVTTDGHNGYTSMNGNINFLCLDGTNYVVTGSNNSTTLKETEWFINNRVWPEGGV